MDKENLKNALEQMKGSVEFLCSYSDAQDALIEKMRIALELEQERTGPECYTETTEALILYDAWKDGQI